MFGVSRDDFVSTNVTQVVHEDLLTQQINERLNVGCHLLLILRLFKLAEVEVRKGLLEELNVESITRFCKRYVKLLIKFLSFWRKF